MPRDLIGEVLLNQYRVERYLASGGMATIYLVWDLKRRVHLAMKVLHPELAEDPTFIRRFQREASSLEQLVHPHIVTFYGLFQDGDLTFMLERYIDGPSLDELLRKRAGQPLPILDALVCFKALYTSLGYAHEQGIVHCDVKPGNVLVDQGGSVYLTDFGISRYMDGSTTTTSVTGTPLYMAPEQVLGQRPTPRTDVYSLGVVLFELLTGRRPFRGDGELPPQAGASPIDRIRYQQLYAPIPDPRLYQADIPESLALVVMKAMAKNPADRYRTVQDMAEDVARAAGSRFENLPNRVRLAAGQPPAADHALEETADLGSPSGPVPGWPATHHPGPKPGGLSRRTIYLLVGAGLLAVCLLGSIGLYQVVSRGLPFLAGQLDPTETLAAGLTASPGGPEVTLSGPVATQPAPASTETPIPIPATETPAAEAQPGGEIVIVMRNSAGRNGLFLLDLATSDRSELPGVPNVQVVYADMPQWSPDGSRLAWRSNYNGRGHIVVMDMNEREPYQLPAGEALDNPQSPAFLPDGERLSFWASGYFVTADAISGERIDQTLLNISANLFVWNPANGLLAYARNQSGAFDVIISGSVNQVDRQIETGGTEYAPAWSQDGEKLAFQTDAGRGAGENEIWSVDWDGNGLGQVTSSPAGRWSRAPTWSPDGAWIAFVSDQAGSAGADYGELFAIHLATKKVIQLTSTGGQVYDWRPAWRP